MIPTQGGDASTDLQKRLISVVTGLKGRTVGADALFDTLKLEVLDWRLDHAVDAEALALATDTAEAIADRIAAAAPAQEASS